MLYSEVTYTAVWLWLTHGIPFGDQLAAVNRARAWAGQALGVDMALILDIPRNMAVADEELVADWAIAALGDGVAALGLAGPEAGYSPQPFAPAFARAGRGRYMPASTTVLRASGPRWMTCTPIASAMACAAWKIQT